MRHIRNIFIILFLCFSSFLQADFLPFCSDRVFFEVNAGFARSFGKAKSAIGTDFAGQFMGINAAALPGCNVNAEFGYKISPCFSAEIAYTYFDCRYEFQRILNNIFAGVGQNESRLHSHVGLVNLILNLNWLCPRFTYNPYILGGIGGAYNSLVNIKQIDNAGVTAPPRVSGRINNGNKCDFAGCFGFGMWARFFCRLSADVKVVITYIGAVQTGNRQTLVPSGVTREIVPYKFRDNFMSSLNAGIRYDF